uniref:Complement C1q A chain n=1 Tax=Laticauda laticaudata TaxID=8630 RepID=A0A8C5RKX0_LATLA
KMASPLWFAAAALIPTLEIVVASDGRDGHPGAPGRNGRPGQKGDLGAPGKIKKMTPAPLNFAPVGGSPPGTAGQSRFPRPGWPPREQGDHGPKAQVGNLQDQPKTAFSASRKNPSPGVSPKTVVFDHSITNQDNTYSTQTGKFTCRVPGYYYFTFQVVSKGSLCLDLMHRDRAVATFCDQSQGLLQVNSGGSVLNLAPGDQVWLDSNPPGAANIYAGTEADSVFSGFLLFPTKA